MSAFAEATPRPVPVPCATREGWPAAAEALERRLFDPLMERAGA